MNPLENTYPHETVDHVWVPVLDTQSAVAAYVTDAVEFSVVPKLTGAVPRPVAWAAAVIIDGKTTIAVAGMAAGEYAVWGRVTVGGDVPVFFCGVLTLS